MKYLHCLVGLFTGGYIHEPHSICAQKNATSTASGKNHANMASCKLSWVSRLRYVFCYGILLRYFRDCIVLPELLLHTIPLSTGKKFLARSAQPQILLVDRHAWPSVSTIFSLPKEKRGVLRNAKPTRVE